MRVLSIQSAVAYGHVGNSAAVFPLQRLGVDVVPVHTVLFSNHTGYGRWRGPRLSPADVADVLLGVEERGVFATVDVVLSGYLGDARTAEVVVDAVRRVRAANPAAVYACDPVMGNARVGRFVEEELPRLIRDVVVPAADVLTPNQYELGLLTDSEPATLEALLESVDAVRAAGPSTVLVTSVDREGAEPDSIEMLAVDGAGAWLVRTPRLPGEFGGTGDVTAALFAAHVRRTGDVAAALERTTASVYELIDATVRAGDEELRLVETQEAFVAPRTAVTAERVR